MKRRRRKLIEVLGIRIRRDYVANMHGYKCQLANGTWVLQTPAGNYVARFGSEQELEKWWAELQRMQGRNPEPLQLVSRPVFRHVPEEHKPATWDDYGKDGHWW